MQISEQELLIQQVKLFYFSEGFSLIDKTRCHCDRLLESFNFMDLRIHWLFL